MVIAINFADEKFKISQRLNSRTAKRFGADRVVEYNPNDIDRDFLDKNKALFECRRGFGYWIWKPYFIDKTLADVSDGDYVIYSDSGSAYVNKISFLIDVMKRDGLDVMCFCIDQIEEMWNKRDALIIMGADKPEILESNQICGTYMIIKKTQNSQQIIKKYLEYVQDERVVSDNPNVMGYENHDMFKDHRHDQSVWSLLCKTSGIKPYRDPSEFGTAAHTDLDVFPKEVLDRSPYPQIFESHRKPDMMYYFQLEYASEWYYRLLKRCYYSRLNIFRKKNG